MKKAGTLRVPSMSCKAFNGRIVLEYLAEVSRLAARSAAADGPNRSFGGWLVNAVAAGEATFVPDPKIPLQACALIRGRNLSYFLFLFKGSLLALTQCLPLFVSLISKDCLGTLVWIDRACVALFDPRRSWGHLR